MLPTAECTPGESVNARHAPSRSACHTLLLDRVGGRAEHDAVGADIEYRGDLQELGRHHRVADDEAPGVVEVNRRDEPAIR